MASKTNGVLEPPNGRVTQGQLYEALYQLDQALAERSNVLLDAIDSGRQDIQQLRKDFEEHREDGHPFTQAAEVVKQELKLDTKKATIVAAFLTFAAAMGAAVDKVIDLLFFS